MPTYAFDESSRFILHDYDAAPPFASFLPGIAGPLGIPMWAFYVNRGQAIASFGVESKDAAILEFQPANKAYQMTPFTGFRTFIKMGEAPSDFYEPFAAAARPAPSRTMIISASELELEETDSAHGLRTRILYFTLPGESFAALVRQVSVQNTGPQPVTLELLDGMPAVVTFGLDDAMLKKMGRTAEAWMAVFNLEAGLPFYRVQASVGDDAEVAAVKGGHFILAFGTGPDLDKPVLHPTQGLAMFVDPVAIFGENTTLSFPERFLTQPLTELQAMPQTTVGRTPCGIAGVSATLAPGESLTLYAFIGHVSDIAVVAQARDRLARPGYVARKRSEAESLVQHLTDPISTQTANPRLDAYCRQSLLDNILRGGWPVRLDGRIYHLYGRRHGDLERDYNAFLLPAEYYSQGNASYRDVNQNRRSDVLFSPAVEDTEVLAFLGLIQADGYNPLTVYGNRFVVPPESIEAVTHLVDRPDVLRSLFTHPFTPGQLLHAIADHGVALSVPAEVFIDNVLDQADQSFEATFSEGYWVDHWFYNLDLIDSYLAIYPDKKDALLFGPAVVPFYDSTAFVQPRRRKYVLAGEGVRQYGAIVADREKEALIAGRGQSPHLMRSAHGQGAIFRTSVFAKLLAVALVKFATLDPLGMGIEMEAGKPGWCDALNGLPGLFGSSLSETYELQRLLDFLLTAVAAKKTGDVDLPIEMTELLHKVVASLAVYCTAGDAHGDFHYWDAISEAREAYRASVRLGIEGRTERLTFDMLAPVLSGLRNKVLEGIQRAEALNSGFPPTYFTYQVDDYSIVRDRAGHPQSDEFGRPFVVPLKFSRVSLPAFLEGPVHALRTRRGTAEARLLYRSVRESGLFDRKLGMYKANVSLADQSHEIGRLRAFTPGWLENESVFLHMTYKYLLEVLRAGLYEEFFEDFRRGLIPFLDPEMYGRSTLENSSFIVSSAHPDKSLHGRGFVARLTGAAAEFLSMWWLMMVGPQPFSVKEDELCLTLRPALPGWLFRKDGTLAFTFLSHCQVIYCNPRLRDTFADGVATRSVRLDLDDGTSVQLHEETIGAPYAEMVRAGHVRCIEIHLD